MIIYHLDNLIKKKEMIEQKKISDTKLAENIGITRQTLAKIRDNHIKPYVTTTEVLDKILKYFKCQQISELIEYVPTP